MNLGAFATIYSLVSVAYLLGLLLFGVALFRARILSRWAAGLLAVSGLLAIIMSLLPHQIARLAAMPMGSCWPGWAMRSLPVAVHIISASVYPLLGAFQFAGGFRRRRPGWHRAAGRLVVVCGLLVGLSGLWMTLFYPWPAGDGALLYGLRLVFGSAMVMSIILGFTTSRRDDLSGHRAWMARGYALGLGAATQMLTLMAGGIIAGPPSELSRALLMGAAWMLNLAIAEWAIRKRRAAVLMRSVS